MRLTDGYTHYELGGPADGRVVVLAAGATVPYYIWDPTFKALVDAGFRVLRYDYYGRGFSDRPDIPFTQDLYVRQLRELLDAVHITRAVRSRRPVVRRLGHHERRRAVSGSRALAHLRGSRVSHAADR